MSELERIRERYTKWEGCGYHSNGDFLTAGNDIQVILTLLDQGRELWKRALKYWEYCPECGREVHLDTKEIPHTDDCELGEWLKAVADE